MCKSIRCKVILLFITSVLFSQIATAKGIITIPANKGISIDSKGETLKNNILGAWGKNCSISWKVELSQPFDGYIALEYGSDDSQEFELSIAGQVSKCNSLVTEGFHVFKKRNLFKERLKLKKGSHTIIIRKPNNRPLMNLRKILLSTQPVARFTDEYPDFYVKKSTWSQTMIAMRNAFYTPEVQNATTYFGKRIKLYMSLADGKAIWSDFSKETDWFIQDNQMHGKENDGKYFDARLDFTTYFDKNRTTELEQKLIASALVELDDAQSTGFTQRMNALINQNTVIDDPAWLDLFVEVCQVRRKARLKPLLEKTQQIVYATHMNMGTIYLATEGQGCPDGSQLRIIDLSPEAQGKPLTDELLFDSNNGIVRDPELSFDGKKLLFAWRKTNKTAGLVGWMAPKTGNYKIYEMDLATRKMRPITDDKTYGADFEPCYLPNDDIMFSSSRCLHEVSCGWGDSSNLYLMDKNGKYARRVGFDQTQTGFPHLLDDGRVIYTRRDYNDRGQSYGHALFTMNPDGTRQTEYYGSNSFYPTSIQHTRQIPGSNKTMGVAGGYHSPQGGKLIKIDTSKATQSYEGIEFFKNFDPTKYHGWGENYVRIGAFSMHPYPFDEQSFLISYEPTGSYLFNQNGHAEDNKKRGRLLYRLYYMNWDGKRELLASHPTLSCTQAIPVIPRKRPSVRASSVDYTKSKGVCYVQNVYYGPSSKGIKPGTIKKLRVIKMLLKPTTIGVGNWTPDRKDIGPGKLYASGGAASVLPVGVGSASFDAKEILGEVDVHSDGSAMFEVPAREPVFFQLIDNEGRAVQTMRSWLTLMPNEKFSCVGCHEENDSPPLAGGRPTIALKAAPQKLQLVPPLTGQPFSYAKTVQPIWNKHCVSCHAPGMKAEKIDLTDREVRDAPERGPSRDTTRRRFFQSYLTLLHVKPRNNHFGPGLDQGRSNKWVNYFTRLATTELTPPYYAGSTKSGLITMLQKGHEKVKLSKREIKTVAAWIDLNVPFIGEYDEMNDWHASEIKLFKDKTDMRKKMIILEQKNIQEFIESNK